MCQLYICGSDTGIPQSKGIGTELPPKHRHLNAGDGCVQKWWGSSQDESLSCTTVSKLALDACLFSDPSHNLYVLWVKGSQITLPSYAIDAQLFLQARIEDRAVLFILATASQLCPEMHKWFDLPKAWLWRPLVCSILMHIVLVEQSVLPCLVSQASSLRWLLCLKAHCIQE